MLARKKTAFLGSAVVALALSLAGATSAQGAAGPMADLTGAVVSGAVVSGEKVAAAADGLDPRLASATDLELVSLLLTGSGALADAHPELVTEFGLRVLTAEKAAAMVPVAEQFLATHPVFTTTWAPAIRSADPLLVDQGINGFMTDFMDYVARSCRPSCTA
ncbi:hypothetical protein [Microbacterium sp. MYb66]|uniref:hypothetical protein n=1 Tax=Microbacterium sp. MYb66 TaxID=1848692 RepID=UPI000CFFE976|nr:hypothetical protein [Microbacterium sp. MYb66]PRA80696.1 hypothetical protein CQ045_10515 [Microbacterium sp. MYb66]